MCIPNDIASNPPPPPHTHTHTHTPEHTIPSRWILYHAGNISITRYISTVFRALSLSESEKKADLFTRLLLITWTTSRSNVPSDLMALWRLMFSNNQVTCHIRNKTCSTSHFHPAVMHLKKWTPLWEHWQKHETRGTYKDFI